MSYKVRRVTKNRVFELIQQVKLRPEDFEWKPVKDVERAEQLVHRPTGYYFTFEMMNDGFWSAWLPPSSNGTHCRDFRSETQQIAAFEEWLVMILEDVEAPDLWGTISSEAELLSGNAVDGNRFFTDVERQLLSDRIDQLEQQIFTLAPNAPAEERVHVHVTLEQAKDAAGRVNRTDWKAIFVGQLIGIIVRLGFEPQKAEALLHYATLYVGPLIARARELLS